MIYKRLENKWLSSLVPLYIRTVTRNPTVIPKPVLSTKHKIINSLVK